MKRMRLKITLKDIAQSVEPSTIIITAEDVELLAEASQRGLLTITQADVKAINESLLQISIDDLPPAVNVNPQKLPRDLNFMYSECYHGTSLASARKIRREGFRVGRRAAHGSGIYFSVGGVHIAHKYLKSKEPCLIRARVNWGRVAYLDRQPQLRGSGEEVTRKALAAGYDSILLSSQFSRKKPATGVVLALKGEHVQPPRISIVELLNPKTGKTYE